MGSGVPESFSKVLGTTRFANSDFSKQKVPKKAFRVSEFICNRPGSMHCLSSLVNVDQRTASVYIILYLVPVVPHKAVAEVSKIGNL